MIMELLTSVQTPEELVQGRNVAAFRKCWSWRVHDQWRRQV